MAQSFMEKRIDPKWIAGMASSSGFWGGTLWFLGFIFAILGIIADATNGTLGLTMMAWFMLAIVFHLAGLSYWVSWALGVYFKAKS
jgi:hypothetical protein